MPQREPKGHYCEDHGVIVHSTHDVELATELAGKFAEEHSLGILGFRRRTWLRTRPARPDEQDAYGIRFWYERAEPGAKGAFRAVEFPGSGRPIGIPVAEAVRDA